MLPATEKAVFVEKQCVADISLLEQLMKQVAKGLAGGANEDLPGKVQKLVRTFCQERQLHSPSACPRLFEACMILAKHIEDEQLASEVQEIAVKTTVELLHAEPFQDQS
eukprot:g1639.t1